MLIESIVRKTLGLKRHCVKKVREKEGQLLVYLVPDKRYKVICSRCGAGGPGYEPSMRGNGGMCRFGGFPSC